MSAKEVESVSTKEMLDGLKELKAEYEEDSMDDLEDLIADQKEINELDNDDEKFDPMGPQITFNLDNVHPDCSVRRTRYWRNGKVKKRTYYCPASGCPCENECDDCVYKEKFRRRSGKKYVGKYWQCGRKNKWYR